MILVTIIGLLISFFLQGAMSNYLGYTFSSLSYFYTIYVLICLLVIRPYFENEKKYYGILILFGFLCDIVYSNTFILNICLFLVIYLFSKLFHHFFPYNYITINISCFLGIVIYQVLSFSLLFLIEFDYYNIGMLLEVIIHSIFMTILYTTFLYFVFDFIKNKFELRDVK